MGVILDNKDRQILKFIVDFKRDHNQIQRDKSTKQFTA